MVLCVYKFAMDPICLLAIISLILLQELYDTLDALTVVQHSEPFDIFKQEDFRLLDFDEIQYTINKFTPLIFETRLKSSYGGRLTWKASRIEIEFWNMS